MYLLLVIPLGGAPGSPVQPLPPGIGGGPIIPPGYPPVVGGGPIIPPGYPGSPVQPLPPGIWPNPPPLYPDQGLPGLPPGIWGGSGSLPGGGGSVRPPIHYPPEVWPPLAVVAPPIYLPPGSPGTPTHPIAPGEPGVPGQPLPPDSGGTPTHPIALPGLPVQLPSGENLILIWVPGRGWIWVEAPAAPAQPKPPTGMPVPKT